MEATTVPDGSDAPALPRLYVSTQASLKEEPVDEVPPGLSHGEFGMVPLDRSRALTLGAGEPCVLNAWLRKPVGADVEGEVRIETPAPVDIEPRRTQPFQLAADEVLGMLAFRVSVSAGAPRRTWPLRVAVAIQGAPAQTEELRLNVPWEWIVTNALHCPPKAGIETPGPLDGGVSEGFPGRVEGARWRLVPPGAFTPYGLLDMRQAVADRSNVMAYAFTRVHCPVAGAYLMDVRHDDTIRVWVNGRLVLTSLQVAPSVATRKLVAVTLREGSNDVLVKIGQVNNYWEFGLWFLDADRRPAAIEGMDTGDLLLPCAE
jgi:hypothetical protein